MALTELEVKRLARKIEMKEPLCKLYAGQALKYIREGSKFGETTDGFAMWLNSNKKAVK
jgi:hypothetical protein